MHDAIGGIQRIMCVRCGWLQQPNPDDYVIATGRSTTVRDLYKLPSNMPV